MRIAKLIFGKKDEKMAIRIFITGMSIAFSIGGIIVIISQILDQSSPLYQKFWWTGASIILLTLFYIFYTGIKAFPPEKKQAIV